MGGFDTSSSTTYTPDPSSLLFLLSSDVPGVSLVSVPFSWTGFGGWSQNMIVSLTARNKIGFIDGSCPRLAEDTPQLISGICLNRRYGSVSGIKVFEIKQEIASTHQGLLDIASCFNKLKKLLDELRFMCTNHANTCVCAAKPGLQKEEEENILHQFLMCLNQTYGDSASFHVNLNNKSAPPRQFVQKVSFDQNKSSLLCKYCKKPGHFIDKCYKLHGFPPNFKFTKGRRTAANVEVQRSACATESGPVSTESPVDSNSVIPGLSKDQYAQLLMLLQQHHISESLSQSNLMASANFAGIVPSPDCVGKAPSMKRPLEIGKQDHGLYKLVQPFSPSSVTSTSSSSPVPFSSDEFHYTSSHEPDPVSSSTHVAFPSSSSIPSPVYVPHSSPVLEPAPAPPIAPSLSPAPSSVSAAGLEPQACHQAASIPAWQEAMRKEFEALKANDTWSIVELPPERYEARLVVRGDTQVEGVDFNETFSPVIKFSTVKCLIAVAMKRNWSMFQLDVNNAFLHGDLDEEVYMKLPPGLSAESVASSSQSSNLAFRQWYAKISHALCSRGNFHSLNDYSLFIRRSGGSTVLLAVYVDDIILTGDDLEEISALKLFLDNQFKIKDLGVLNYFLGIEVAYLPSGILLHQRTFIRDLLHDCNCDMLSHVTCPMDLNSKLKAAMGDPLPSPDTYRSLVGKLNFLTHTRPDLCFAVQHLSQFMQAPCTSHMKVALHLLRYLKGDSLIGWKAKKQPVVSLSSAEAEYRALSKVVAELTWVVRLLSDFGVAVSYVVPVFSDNQAAIHIAKNPVFHEQTKHIELDCHLVRNKLGDGLISLHHVPTTSQLADIFTKPLTGAIHHSLLLKLGVVAPSNLKGGVGL
ncbi:PREDICTED: uncharacterized protein LOC109224252 [Nicotiana attenuata]|uniref:uncharacterized protein LOC109224252 n=1 Tax=Nicotiana attenuata TaxID=49451 RepID=UPI0009050174|nr:PREDICTED: uncharacterized protein LOC109224252 [Nicotiana attenuata]